MFSLPAGEVLEQLAHGTRVPGAGPAAAFVTATAAALATMSARISRGSWAGAGAAVAQADALRARANRLALADAEALAEYLVARVTTADERQEVRDFRLGQALDRAAEVPLAIAEAACDVAQLSAHVADHCEGDVRADAAAAAVLAAGAARAAAHLIEVNLGVAVDDERVLRAGRLVRAAETAADQALRDGAP